MSIKVKGLFEDIGGAGRVTELRRKKLANASSRPDPRDPIRELADRLHPAEMKFRCVSVTDASPSAKTFRFESVDGHIPVFQCGQFVNFRLRIGESLLTRPYTISSAPYEARGEKPFFEITVRRNVPYLVPDYLFENVKPGDVLDGALPFGTFYWEPLRDTKNIVALAGGSGITPFYSMAKEIAHGKMRGCTLTILYGSVKSDDIVLKAELDKVCAECKAVKVVHVLSDDPTWQGEKGFITKELIEKYSSPDCTYMFCGPLAMFRFVSKALDEMGVAKRRFRHDVVTILPISPPCPATPSERRKRRSKFASCAVCARISSRRRHRNPLPLRSSAARSRSIPTAATASAASAAASCCREIYSFRPSATGGAKWIRKWAGSTPARPIR